MEAVTLETELYQQYINDVYLNELFFVNFENESINKYVSYENELICFQDYEYKNKNNSYERWIKEIFKDDSEAFYSFRKIEIRLTKCKQKIFERKNADVREFRIYKNYYLVKSYFTFGLQTVNRDEKIIIMTTNKHLDLYVPKKPMEMEDGAFKKNTEHLFNKYAVPPFHVLVMDPYVRYLIIAPHKCLFYFERRPISMFTSKEKVF